MAMWHNFFYGVFFWFPDQGDTDEDYFNYIFCIALQNILYRPRYLWNGQLSNYTYIKLYYIRPLKLCITHVLSYMQRAAFVVEMW